MQSIHGEKESSHEKVDVVIIGGGPTGLFAGLLLHRLGVSIRVLDSKPQSLEYGRADALNARTQQYFQVANLLEEMLPQGLKCNTSSTFCNGEFTSRQNHWWTSLEHAQHKNFLMIGQPVIEAIMSRVLGSLVSYNEHVISISESQDGVHVVTQTGRSVRAAYAFAADGARSTVRSALGISFEGTKPEMVWAVLDTFIDTDFPVCPEIITFELCGQSRVAWIPRERGLSRFYVLLDDDSSGENILEHAQEAIKEHLAPYRVDFRSTEWYSTFEVKERIASSFISKGGRVLLGGDSAHVHSVNGGQGLNTGISDAFAAAWRLYLVLHTLPDNHSRRTNLLQSYDLERRGTAAGVIQVAHDLVRDTRGLAKQYVSTIERRAAYITGMGISYECLSSTLIHESQRGIWRAGYRCPDVPLIHYNSGEEKWLYDLVAYGSFLVLSMGERHRNYNGLGASSRQNLMTVYNILPATSTNDQPPGTEDNEGQVFRARWLQGDDNFVVVVRPDMYVGLVAGDWTDVDRWFEGW